MKISKVVGIDLGTTNSVIALIGPDNKTILCSTDAQGRRTFPSAVVWDKRSGGLKAGQVAFNRRGTTPEPVTSIKRRMGDVNYRAQVGDREMSPIEVSAEILKEMKRQMQEYLHKTPGCEDYVVDRAIVTIPAYFRSEAAEATAKAGALAGLEVVKTLQEPSSSSAYYCWKNNIEDGIFMVYDLGGGTFDVSIVRYAAGEADVLGIAGNNYLGGDTFDELLAKMLVETLQDEGYSLDLAPDDEKDAQRFTKLRLAAEVIKKALSDKMEYYHTHDGIFTDQEGATVNLAITVQRDEFESLIEPILQGTLDKCREALAEAESKGVTLDMIDGVLLVGGSTHIPLIGEFVRKNFCDPALPSHTKAEAPFHDDPDMAVGFGAAVSAMGFSAISIDDSAAESSGNKDADIFASEVQPAIGIGGKSTVFGAVKVIKGTLPTGMTAMVSKADGSFDKEFPIEEDGKFKLSGLPAASEDEPYLCRVEAGGKAVLSFRFNAAAATIQPPPTTLAHSLYVELLDISTGKLSRRALIEKGTNLPASRDYQFKTTQEYSVKIKVYEDNTQLCSIVLPFENSVPIGSPVSVSLEIDEKSTKHVYATAAGESQDAYLEAPPLEQLTEGNLREKLSEFESKLKVLPPTQQILAKAKKKNLESLGEEIKQGIAENDQVRAREAYDEMSKIIEETGGSSIDPPESVFRALVEECFTLNREHHKSNPENDEKIRGYQQRVAEYYAQMNQMGVTNEYQGLKELKEFLEPDVTPPGPPKWMIVKMGMCVKIREDMRTASENAGLPPQLRRRADAERDIDNAKVSAVDNQMGPFTTDEEAVSAMMELRPIMQRWESYAEYDDTAG